MAERRTRTAAQKHASLLRREAAIAARAEMSPAGPADGRMRIATWNLNSLRTRLHAVERFLDRTVPDIVCLQETKVPQLSTVASAMFERRGYHVAHAGTSGYNGVVIASKTPLREVEASGAFGDEHLDREPRLVTCFVDAPEPLRVVSAY